MENSITNISLVHRFGNKKALLKKTNFIKYFPACDRTGFFYDAFTGTGLVSFAYMEKMKRIGQIVGCIMNDKDDKLIRFFECIHRRAGELESALKWRFKGSERVIEEKTEIDGIVKWFLENRGNFFIDKPVVNVKSFDKWRQILDYHQVLFWNRDYKDVISLMRSSFSRLVDRNSHAILYCDPPYADTRDNYDMQFDLKEFLMEMNKFKEEIDGKNINAFIFISLNKHKKVEEKLDGWYKKELLKFGNNKGRRPRIEMLYSNFPVKNRKKNLIEDFF